MELNGICKTNIFFAIQPGINTWKQLQKKSLAKGYGIKSSKFWYIYDNEFEMGQHIHLHVHQR